jgi:hypothetical protein
MTTDLYALSRVSALLGMAYGNLFALLPIVVLEWFGLGELATSYIRDTRANFLGLAQLISRWCVAEYSVPFGKSLTNRRTGELSPLPPGWEGMLRI